MRLALLLNEDHAGRARVRGVAWVEEEALTRGVEEKSREFVEKGAEVYAKA